MLATSTTCWVLTDGKAGDEVQCLGVAEELGLTPQVRRVAPRAPFVWLMPWGPIDPREAPARPGSPIAPPFPDILIASGRRAVPYLRAVKRASGGRTFTAFLKDPRTGTGAADFIWVPQHDKLRGPNVLATLTSPHRISPKRLADAAGSLPPEIAGLPKPRVALLVGGDSRNHVFTSGDIERFSGPGGEPLLRGAHHGHGIPPLARAPCQAACAKSSRKAGDGGGMGPEATHMSPCSRLRTPSS